MADRQRVESAARTCKSCGKPGAYPPERVMGHFLPQMCGPCRLKRADRIERQRRLFQRDQRARIGHLGGRS
jgi:hypothetical protein